MKLAFEGEVLLFGNRRIVPSIRTFSDMASVLAKQGADCMPPETPLYYMYRGASKFSSIQRAPSPSASQNASHSSIRYDITKIEPADLCGERSKTFGHSHPKSQKGAYYTEMYEVLYGSAHFLLQKVTSMGVEDAVLLAAKKGSRFVVPPGYGHVTINAGKTPLVMGNLVSDKFESDYSLYSQKRGACFYEMKGGKLVKNKNYGDFEIRKAEAVKFSSRFGVFAPFAKKTLFDAAQDYKNIEFLEKPEMFY